MTSNTRDMSHATALKVVLGIILALLNTWMLAGCKTTDQGPSAGSSQASLASSADEALSGDSSTNQAHSSSSSVVVHGKKLSSSISPASPDSVSQEGSQEQSSGNSKRIRAIELGDLIMGPGLAHERDMVSLFEEHGAVYPEETYAPAGAPTIEDFCILCIEEASEEGVRPEVLFAQAMHETGWLGFGNQVSVEQCNFGGLGALTSGGEGEHFANVRTGLRAQVQHLLAYASTNEPKHEIVDPRFELVERGCAPRVHDLEGRWAWPGDGYGDAIMAIVDALLLEDAHGLAEFQNATPGGADKILDSARPTRRPYNNSISGLSP